MVEIEQVIVAATTRDAARGVERELADPPHRAVRRQKVRRRAGGGPRRRARYRLGPARDFQAPNARVGRIRSSRQASRASEIPQLERSRRTSRGAARVGRHRAPVTSESGRRRGGRRGRRWTASRSRACWRARSIARAWRSACTCASSADEAVADVSGRPRRRAEPEDPDRPSACSCPRPTGSRHAPARAHFRVHVRLHDGPHRMSEYMQGLVARSSGPPRLPSATEAPPAGVRAVGRTVVCLDEIEKAHDHLQRTYCCEWTTGA